MWFYIGEVSGLNESLKPSLVSSSELVYSLQLLEGDGVGAARLGQDFSLCHSELH